MRDREFRPLDEALLDGIRSGRNTIKELSSEASNLMPLARSYCVKDPWRGRTVVVRIIERRLQSLRKSGAISFDGKMWRISNDAEY